MTDYGPPRAWMISLLAVSSVVVLCTAWMLAAATLNQPIGLPLAVLTASGAGWVGCLRGCIHRFRR